MPAIPSYPDDLFTDEALLDAHRHYRALRELAAVVFLEAHDMYAVCRYADARAVLADADTFCSGKGVGLNEAVNATMGGANLIMTDGELHARLRDHVGRGLTPRALRSMREAVERRADDLVAGLVANGSFDAVADLARVLPLSVVPDLVGWPAGGRERLLEWASASFDVLGPPNERAERAIPVVRSMFEYTTKTASEGTMLAGSLGAAVIEAAARGELEPAQVPSLLIAYIAPSLDTTISAIGAAVWLLASHPEQWRLLRSKPALVPNAFNEVVRLESPIRAFTRVTTTSTAIDGYEIEAGSRIAVFFGAANRDRRRFARPETFDVSRDNAAAHLGFGYGTHGCAGQGLARIEAHSVLQALVQHVDHFELGPAVRGVNNLISSWASVPVSAHPSREMGSV